MRILVTNDDGIHAVGLKVLERVARQLSDDVWVVAPESDQSGVSHSLSLAEPLRLREISERHFAVKGTPTDCVIMGIKHVLKDKAPDLVLSGINRGHNIADDVTYSGTIAAAIEGTTLGVRSIALSQAYAHFERHPVRWETAEALAPDLIRRLMVTDLPQGTFLNVNFPDVAVDDVRGVRVTCQGKRDQQFLDVEEREDGRGLPYFWMTFKRFQSQMQASWDMTALHEGYISVTPLQLDLTDTKMLDALAAQLS